MCLGHRSGQVIKLLEPIRALLTSLGRFIHRLHRKLTSTRSEDRETFVIILYHFTPIRSLLKTLAWIIIENLKINLMQFVQNLELPRLQVTHIFSI